MTNFRLMLLSTAAAGLVAVAVSPASAGEVTKSMSVSGHVNRMIIVSDDGLGTTIAQIDPTDISGSRFRIKGAAKSESMTIGVTTELGVQRNPTLDSQTNAGTASINIRHSYVYFKNNMGMLTMGHTSTADDGSTSNTLSGTGVAGFYDGTAIAGQNLHVTGSKTPGTTAVKVGNVLQNYEGTRDSLVKYSSPDMNGFKVVASLANAEGAAAAVHYAADFSGTKVAATAAWGSRKRESNINAEYGGSIAVGLAGGLYGSVAYSKRDLNTNAGQSNAGFSDPRMWGASVGYKMGANGITAWYYNTDDAILQGAKAKSYALVVEHKMKAYGTELYGGIQTVKYDTPAAQTQYDDLTAGWVGVRVKF